MIIAGPNGAGKTTFAAEFLIREGKCAQFINADLIARDLSPSKPEKVAFRAGRLMLERLHEAVRRGENFAFETTLSGLVYAALIPTWQRASYFVDLIFLSLPSQDFALARIRNRVAQGGHNVPDPVVRRRFDAGLKNFHALYRPLVDSWILYDNADVTPVLLGSGDNA